MTNSGKLLLEASQILGTYCSGSEPLNEATLVERYKSVGALQAASKEFNKRVKSAETNRELKFACDEFKKKLGAAKVEINKMSENDIIRYVTKLVARVVGAAIFSTIGVKVAMNLGGKAISQFSPEFVKAVQSAYAKVAGRNAAIATSITTLIKLVSGNASTKTECLKLIDKMSAVCDDISSLGVDDLKKARKLAKRMNNETKRHAKIDI